MKSLTDGLWKEMAKELPAEVEFNPCGTIWVATDEDEMAEVCRKHGFYRDRGVASEILDERQLMEAEPNLRAGLAGGLLVSGDCVLFPPPLPLPIQTHGCGWRHFRNAR